MNRFIKIIKSVNRLLYLYLKLSINCWFDNLHYIKKNLGVSIKNINFAGNLRIIRRKENEYFLQMA